MTTVADVRSSLAGAIEAGCPGWRADAYIGNQLNPPCFKVSVGAFDPRMVFTEAKKSVTFTVYAYATFASDQHGEALLDELIEPTGTGSLIAAVQTSSNWYATVDFAQVTNVGAVQTTTWGTEGTEYFVRSFDVEVVW